MKLRASREVVDDRVLDGRDARVCHQEEAPAEKVREVEVATVGRVEIAEVAVGEISGVADGERRERERRTGRIESRVRRDVPPELDLGEGSIELLRVGTLVEARAPPHHGEQRK